MSTWTNGKLTPGQEAEHMVVFLGNVMTWKLFVRGSSGHEWIFFTQVMRRFDVFIGVNLNKLLNKQSSCPDFF